MKEGKILLKKTLAIMLSLALIFAMMPATAFASGEEITVSTYEQLWSAFYSNDDYHITLANDITYNVPDSGNSPLSPWQYLLGVSGTENKVLDLNGHTLKVVNEQTSWLTQSGLFTIDDSASLTVMDGKIELYNYNNNNRTDMGVFNAVGGYLTLTDVDVLNGRDGTTINAQSEATVVIEGGTISAFNGFAVTAINPSWVTLDKDVILTTTTGSGLVTQAADDGYGSLHASTSNLTVVSAVFEAGIEVAEETIGQFSPSQKRLVFVGNKQYEEAFATSRSGDYYWNTNATGGCALVVSDGTYCFAQNVHIISTTSNQAVTVQNGSASLKQATYGTTVTITAEEIQGKVFSGWHVERGDVTLADSSAKTTTFIMGSKPVEITAIYENEPISHAEFTVVAPVQGEHLGEVEVTTATEHISVSEIWCVEVYEENSFSSALPEDYIFEGGHLYRVGVAFELEQGYSLDDGVSVTFVDSGNDTQRTASQGATPYIWFVDYVVEDNSVEISSATATVNGIEAGATVGSTSVTTEDTTYTVSIKGWYDCDNVFNYGSETLLQPTDTLVGGKTYTICVTFTPVGSNTLANKLITSINGEEGKIGESEANGRSFFVTVTVPMPQYTDYMVSYYPGEAEGSPDSDMIEGGTHLTLADCMFSAPKCCKFKAWAVGSPSGTQYQPGEKIEITEDTYIYAIWESDHDYTPATCMEPKICKKCKASEGVELGHAYADVYTIDKRATKSADGSMSKHCTRDGCTDKDSVTTIPKISSEKLSSTLYTYDGSVKTPTVTVKDANGNTLVKDTDYTVTYPSGRKNIGQYTVTITYKGKYYGSTKLTYTIGPKNPSTITAKLYGHDDVQFTWSKVSGAAGYKIYYKKASAASYTTIGRVTGTSYKLPDLADNTKYVFKVIAYQNVNGVNCYNAGKTCEVTTKVPTTNFKASLSSTLYTYNGSAKTPSVTVKDANGNVLKKDTDYTVTYPSSRTAIGKYTVTITYKGKYYGSTKLTYTIGPKNPTTVKAALYGHDDVQVKWSKVSGAAGYKVYYKKSTDASYTTVGTTTATSYKIPNLADGAKYTFKVITYQKVSGNNCYNAGKTCELTMLKKVPGIAVAKSSSSVKVSWTDIAGQSGYQISQSTTKDGTTIVATYATTSGTSKTVTATKGKTYYYKVRAYKTEGDKKIYGPWSDVKAFKLS